jgi:hypothetical protein
LSGVGRVSFHDGGSPGEQKEKEKENAMTRRSLLAFAVIAASLSLAACAGNTAATSPEARTNHPAWLTGQWQATGWQVGADTDQAQGTTLVNFASNGAWTTPAGGSGTSWLAGDKVYVEGTTRDGYKFQYSLEQRQNADGSRDLYGVVAARPGAAQVSLKKMR